jgi:hypothetical protein
MKLSDEQKQAVARWLAGNASIAEVQRRLREEFSISLTYMDTRFLIDDLGLHLTSPKAAEKPAAREAPGAGGPAKGEEEAIEAEAEYVDEGDEFAEAAEESLETEPGTPAKGGSVQVEVDRIMRPGTVVSGSVTFSDGKKGTWALDQVGRLIFEGKTAGYRPGKADLQAFQRELSKQLQRHGF